MTESATGALRSVRLLQPWMGGACLALVVILAAVLWVTRTRHLPRPRQLAAPAAGLALGAGCWLAVDVVWRPVADGIGPLVWMWVGLAAFVVAQVLLGGSAEADRERVRTWKRRLVRASGSGASVVAVVAAALLAINAFFAAFPSLAAVLGLGVATTPLAALPTAAPHAKAPQRGEGALSTTWVAPDDMPPRGQVVTAPIPAGDQSGTRGFSPRDAVIYLPPAYLTQARPALPVVVALTGQPGSPSDWFELGGLKDTMDAYAAAHDGLAPVVVVADLLGSPYRNPLCSDTVRGGRVATYLERDVPDWIRQNLQVDLDPEHWAVAGLSNGGTCALQVAARSPEVYRNFLAMSAEEHPSLGSEQRTINVGFDGDRASYEANDPLTIMASAPPGRYSGVSGIVSVGRDDKQYRPVVPVLVDATTQAGMSVSQREYAGGHTWATWSVAMADQMDWLGRRLGIVPDV